MNTTLMISMIVCEMTLTTPTKIDTMPPLIEDMVQTSTDKKDNEKYNDQEAKYNKYTRYADIFDEQERDDAAFLEYIEYSMKNKTFDYNCIDNYILQRLQGLDDKFELERIMDEMNTTSTSN